ncbi:MAG: hypothetical protein KY445_02445, partial [Armatimonadetes bacterium]|nr:hypothetical protein [Armatimonadota bacterium]
SDQLRLTTMPTAAQGASPVSFGDKVSVATRVVPWVIDVPAPDAVTGVSLPNGPLARWSAALPIGGIYAVYAAPPRPAQTRGEKPFSYRIETLDGPRSVQARPEHGGKGFLFAGYFAFPEPSKQAPTVTVELQSAPRGVERMNAGVVRLVGPFPAVSNRAPDLSQIPDWK